ncbi:Serine protease [Mycena venus]|uniref:Serine protease n=1 Tax=Mycena venus TaxID=2733690 RepID=A0A8H6YW58_9AGAR|nr:Serine protease [Mycena venus]
MSATGPAIWSLKVPEAYPSPQSETVPDPYNSMESVLGEDFRGLIDPADFVDGGRFRSIVKIQSRCNNQGEDFWMMASGWLIGTDLLVTAGHVVYDKAYGCGAATQIKCYIGYNGADSVPKQGSSSDGAVQPRYGSRVVTTQSWIKDSDSRLRDVAFIKVHKPFVGDLNVFEFNNNTVSPSTALFGVVGYPGDKNFRGEFGAQLYELFNNTTYDLDKQPRHMIE